MAGIQTLWLDSDPIVPGQDQVGVRANLVRMYSYLVPGITNVTDRIRYFAIHPFIVHMWAKGKATTDKAAFQHLVRRVECILAISERIRVRGTDEVSAGVVGRIRIDRWLRDKPDRLPDDLRVPLGELEREYFRNSWGGFGQYYRGPEQDLQIIGWQEDLPRLRKPLGPQLVNAIESAVERSRLSQLLSEDRPRVAQFRRIGEVLGFNTQESEERRILRDVLLDISGRYKEPGLSRRRSLLLLLAASQQSTQGIKDPAWEVMEAALHGRIPLRKAFSCPAGLNSQLRLWRVYTLNEFLAFALEIVLAVSVEKVGEAEVTTRQLNSVAGLGERVSSQLPRTFSQKLFGDLVTECSTTIRRPALDPVADKFEEGVLRRAAAGAMAQGRHGDALRESLKLIARLAARIDGTPELRVLFNEVGLRMDEARIGLDGLLRFVKNNRSSKIKHFAIEIVKLVVNTHLRIATAKLAHNNDYTFKLVFEGGILRKVREVEPTFSHPRLQQGAQMLADVGLLTYESGVFHITQDGIGMLRDNGCLHG